MKILNQIVQWTWCLPQNLVGVVVLLVTKIQGAATERYKGCIVSRWKDYRGVSLGQFLFVNANAADVTVKHEYGHSKQSLMLGWLYLLVVGLPSIIWAGCFAKYRMKHGVGYYSVYPENWADKLGGVKRSRKWTEIRF